MSLQKTDTNLFILLSKLVIYHQYFLFDRFLSLVRALVLEINAENIHYTLVISPQGGKDFGYQ